MDDKASEDRTLPTEDDTSRIGERWRQFLLRRRDDAAAKLLEASKHLGTTQVRASEAGGSDEEILALVQVLTESAEANLLSLEEGYKRIERLSAAMQPVEAWADSRKRLDLVADDWDTRLTAAREGWMRAAEEIPRQVAEATAQVLRAVLEENRATLRWLLAGAALMSMLLSATAFWSWRAHALLTVAFTPVTDARSAGRHEAVKPPSTMKTESDLRRNRR